MTARYDSPPDLPFLPEVYPYLMWGFSTGKTGLQLKAIILGCSSSSQDAETGALHLTEVGDYESRVHEAEG